MRSLVTFNYLHPPVYLSHHQGVDCVIFGFVGDRLPVLGDA